MKSETNIGSGLLWGADAIAQELGVPRRRAFYLLSEGLIPARKVGSRWVTTREALRASLADPLGREAA